MPRTKPRGCGSSRAACAAQTTEHRIRLLLRLLLLLLLRLTKSATPTECCVTCWKGAQNELIGGLTIAGSEGRRCSWLPKSGCALLLLLLLLVWLGLPPRRCYVVSEHRLWVVIVVVVDEERAHSSFP